MVKYKPDIITNKLKIVVTNNNENMTLTDEENTKLSYTKTEAKNKETNKDAHK
jgi:hypothetical protein